MLCSDEMLLLYGVGKLHSGVVPSVLVLCITFSVMGIIDVCAVCSAVLPGCNEKEENTV